MSKAILVIDMPKSCEECPCCYLTEGCYSDICQVNRNGLEEGYEKGRPNWCPLSEVPQKKGQDMTNADKIRAMTDEELAHHFSELIKDTQEHEYCTDVTDWLNWLKCPTELIGREGVEDAY